MVSEVVLEAIRLLVTAMFAFAVALFVSPIVIRILKRLSFGKQIRTEESAPIMAGLHKKKEGTPTMGGVVIWGTVLAIAFGLLFTDFNFIDRSETYLPLAALVIAAFLGLIDDILGVWRKGPLGGGLTVKHKLISYTLLGVLGAWWFYYKLGFTSIHIPFFGEWEVGAWYFLIFVFVIIASTFSANETDGLDGLLGGVMLFALGALTLVAFVIGKFHLAVLGGAILGALLAFLWFNIYPARFFMGDTGSMALGGVLGTMAMLTDTVVLLPLFFIIPVIESLSVIVQQISKRTRGKKIFLSTPIHHHFEAKGSPESQITMRFWIISIVSVGLGLVIFFIDRFV
ncbi:MAG: phospho-N-acetylmuramoyl-pentapeptide-transferase [Candidatus Colwellbacteria bacterium]|nr:phospho-N-acetylmuramoyl-pentapeptide-transferase [Candidatus Colwellbacteria bacterium]